MKLTTEQIATIEETLVLNGVVYDDIKLELLDHIASEIEATMAEKDISFETAYKQAFENWEEQLRPSSSLWLDMKDAVPKIVLDKWILESKKKLIKGTILGILLANLLALFEKIINNEPVFTNTRAIFQGIFILELTLIILCKFFIWKSVQKTFTGFVFQKQTKFAVLFVFFIFSIGGLPTLFFGLDFKVNLGFSFLTMSFLISPIFFLQLAFKHFQFENKMKVI